MKHSFTESEIAEAADRAVDETTSHYRAISIHYHQQFLHALPEPATDDWQSCEFNQIRKGDRVRVVYPDGDLKEFDVRAIDKAAMEGVWDVIYAPTKGALYRIPAKIQHPDPAEHPVIIDEAGRPWFSTGLDEYHSPHQHSVFRNPRDFANWSPGKVVEDDR